MLKYILSFAAGFTMGKIVTKENVSKFKRAALKSYVVVRKEFCESKTEEVKEGA